MKYIIPNTSFAIQLGILSGALLGSFFVLQSIWVLLTIPFVLGVYWFYSDMRLILLTATLIGFIGGGYYSNTIIDNYYQIQESIPNRIENTEVVIASSPRSQAFGYQYKVYIPKYTAKAFMTIKDDDLIYGERLIVKAKTSIPEEAGIRRFLLGRGIHRYMTSSDYQIQSNNNCNIQCQIMRNIIQMQKEIIIKIDTAYPNQVGEFLKGILIGYTDTLPAEIKESFKKTGVSHILAVSGYNMAIIVILVYQQLINKQIYKPFSFWITIAIMILFTLLTGAEASIMRAGIFAIIILSAEQLQRYVGGMRPLILCATILVLINPLYIGYDIGFQLSFLAVIGLILYGQLFKTYLEGIPSFGILSMIGETLFAQILVLPLLIYYFGQVSLISIIANILIVPVIPFAMAWGSITALLLPWKIFTYPLVILIQSVLSMNQYLASLSWASITVFNITGYMLISIYAIMGIGYWLYIKQRKI